MLPSVTLGESATTLNAPRELSKPHDRETPNESKASAFLAAIKIGDAAYLIRDFESARASYREALMLDPESAVALYRLGETERAAQHLGEARVAFETALRFVDNDHALKAKLLFVLADLAERSQSFDVARGIWNEYAEFAAVSGRVRVFATTAIERLQRLEAKRVLDLDYVAVSARIKEREAAASRPKTPNP
jgi:tetratricopeptide (TPR) repeat protein